MKVKHQRLAVIAKAEIGQIERGNEKGTCSAGSAMHKQPTAPSRTLQNGLRMPCLLNINIASAVISAPSVLFVLSKSILLYQSSLHIIVVWR